MFKYPIGVQLFNRPKYAERLLLSLSKQSSNVNQNRLHIFIDGYSGSSYEINGTADRTTEIETLAREIFPESKIVKFETNQGVARLHQYLQSTVFSAATNWATFFEEDIELEPSHLQEIENLIEIVDDFDEVVKVACFQSAPAGGVLSRGVAGFYKGIGTKAYAERQNFFETKSNMIEEFLRIESLPNLRKYPATKGTTMVKDSVRIALLSNPNALGVPIRSFNKDLAIDAYLYKIGKLHVVTKPNLASDIGIDGMHGYVTPAIDADGIMEFPGLDIQTRKKQFEESIPLIRRDFDEYYFTENKLLMEGYFVSLSGRNMLKKISKAVIAKLASMFNFKP